MPSSEPDLIPLLVTRLRQAQAERDQWSPRSKAYWIEMGRVLGLDAAITELKKRGY
jgi:hypothetical protein